MPRGEEFIAPGPDTSDVGIPIPFHVRANHAWPPDAGDALAADLRALYGAIIDDLRSRNLEDPAAVAQSKLRVLQAGLERFTPDLDLDQLRMRRRDIHQSLDL